MITLKGLMYVALVAACVGGCSQGTQVEAGKTIVSEPTTHQSQRWRITIIHPDRTSITKIDGETSTTTYIDLASHREPLEVVLPCQREEFDTVTKVLPYLLRPLDDPGLQLEHTWKIEYDGPNGRGSGVLYDASGQTLHHALSQQIFECANRGIADAFYTAMVAELPGTTVAQRDKLYRDAIDKAADWIEIMGVRRFDVAIEGVKESAFGQIRGEPRTPAQAWNDVVESFFVQTKSHEGVKITFKSMYLKGNQGRP